MGVFHNGDHYARAMHPPVFTYEMWFLNVGGYVTMARFLHSFDTFTLRKFPKMFLALSWLLGLGLGGLVFRYAGAPLLSLMPLAVNNQLSIVSLFLSTSLPFLLCAFGVHLLQPWLVMTVCFGKALLYGFLVCGVFAAFGSYGWLIRLLLLFTDSLACVLLYGYAHRHITAVFPAPLWSLTFCELAIGLFVYLDFSYVSPLLRQLLSLQKG